jgi:alkylation response protein AidB-like acyl-CoA dehydrogenase
MRFVLFELHGAQSLTNLPGYQEATPDLFQSVLEAAGGFMTEKLLPLNRSGDEEGSHFENGTVRTPAGFKQAYDEFAAGGWISLAAVHANVSITSALLHVAVEEMICSTNLSFGMFPGLSQGAYNALMLHGSEELKQRYLPGLVDGSVAGTMCLTEPQCGTDLGLVRTKAEPAADGSYKITGSKIFISAGEHDLTENILHLVLARLPDAPAGTRGISLFLVPKLLPDRMRNRFSCGGIEKKMGIHASPTCQMNFDGATGWLVGRPHKGMSAMFTMMNAARLGVATQGLGLAEAADQRARDYAMTRLQGRSPRRREIPGSARRSLIVHPDIRRMLLGMRPASRPPGRWRPGWRLPPMRRRSIPIPSSARRRTTSSL